ncbi:TetR/AcrR family transcriptional regulator [Rhodoplanes roseus]|uniref:HTH tetR-type domain-containing protein n=1 Tax=Rhodoplanes roseus TaxID=29409 RepID=A0A327L8L3_9BRAD|nr:TetR/AcrR family transcriptional regulator [Rhodoplanes roseus]RAI44038.1 hypothetical protein CH341_11195 [Rhodoplanes roseus]
MRVSREQAEKNRRHVVEVASRLFRERGFDGIGIADLMKAAGLTQGAFYGQFRSKDHLAAEATAAALAASRSTWDEVTAAAEDDGLGALTRRYLSDDHRRRVAQGCPLPALAADVARSGPEARAAFRRGLKGHADMLAGLLSPAEENPAGGRDAALATLSTMVGAVLLSRAVDDDTLAERILAAAAADVSARARPSQAPPRVPDTPER